MKPYNLNKLKNIFKTLMLSFDNMLSFIFNKN